MKETREEYLARMSILLTPEMRPFLHGWTTECDCGMATCRGWRLPTMFRSELPPEARAKKSERKTT